MTTKTRKTTIADLIIAEAAQPFEVWEAVVKQEPAPEPVAEEPQPEEALSHTPAFLFLMAAVAIFIVGRALIACALLAFNLGRKAVNAAIDARAKKVDFRVYQPIFEGLNEVL